LSLLPKCEILYFVSDRAKALINLAKKKHQCPSVADCFHFKYNLNKLLSLALSAKLRSAQLNLAQSTATTEVRCIEAADSAYATIQFHTDLYVESMANISQILHPYSQGNKKQTKESATVEMNTTLSNIEQVIEQCQIKDTYKLFNKSKNQLDDVISVIPLWHNFVADELELLLLNEKTKKWFTEFLLPKIYWEQALKKTKYPPQRNYIKQQISRCKTVEFQMIDKVSEQEHEKLYQKALFLSAKFQRTSSRVEGRNGFLSQINHNQKSFDKTRLQVMTVIHNFDTRGVDGKMPAERLFGNKMSFEPLFEYIIKNIQELPRPRKRKLRN
jgi:hypothetical protein